MPAHNRLSPSYLLYRATQLSNRHFETILGHRELTHSQVQVLFAVADKLGISQKQVSDLTSIDRSTMTDLVERLIRKDLIRRQRSRVDARRYSLSLTDKGNEVVAEARPLVRSVDERILASLTPAEAAVWVQLLARIVSLANKTRIGESNPSSNL